MDGDQLSPCMNSSWYPVQVIQSLDEYHHHSVDHS